MTLTIHRGSHEIGGSCVVLESEAQRLVIDLGLPLVERDGSPFDARQLQGKSVAELQEAGILPGIAGLFEDNGLIQPLGVLLSHAHLDHHGLIDYLRPGTPLWCGTATRELIEVGAFYSHHGRTDIFDRLRPEVIEDRKVFSIGPFEVTPFLMDHSAFDSYAFLIEADGKRVLYSGDFRGHGRKSAVFESFVANPPRNIDVLLMEGTTLGGTVRKKGPVRSEVDIEVAIKEASQTTSGLVFVMQSSQNIDRLVSVYKAVRDSGRVLVMDVYTAEIMATLARRNPRLPHPSRSFPLVRVLFTHHLTDRLFKEGENERAYRFVPFKITRAEIEEAPERHALIVRASMRCDLEHFKCLEGGLVIYSQYSGYLDQATLRDFVAFTEARGMSFRTIHTSGHADRVTLGRMVETLSPRALIPIHTFAPEEYGEFGVPVLLCGDGEVVVL